MKLSPLPVELAADTCSGPPNSHDADCSVASYLGGPGKTAIAGLAGTGRFGLLILAAMPTDNNNVGAPLRHHVPGPPCTRS